MRRLNKKGYTLIELMISISFFSLLLLMIIYGFVQINRSYTRGIVIKTIQESSRDVIEDISNTIRTSTNVSFISPSYPTVGQSTRYRLCLDGVRYAWNQQNESKTTLEVSDERYITNETFSMVRMFDNGSCTDNIDKRYAEEVLDNRAMIQHFEVKPVAGTNNSYRLVLTVSTKGTADLLKTYGVNATCDVKVGDQFCDVAKFNTVVTSRND